MSPLETGRDSTTPGPSLALWVRSVRASPPDVKLLP
jgi:hypothetical protein